MHTRGGNTECTDKQKQFEIGLNKYYIRKKCLAFSCYIVRPKQQRVKEALKYAIVSMSF